MYEKIKETCSCGAVLEFEEKYDKAYFEMASSRQRDFHKAHEKCRNK